MQFADSNHFIAFGQHVSIDLRIKCREMISGRCVKTFVVSQKIVDDEFLTSEFRPSMGGVSRQLFKDNVVYAVLKSMVYNLANQVEDAGYESLYNHLYGLALDAEHIEHFQDPTCRGALAYLTGELLAMNFVTPVIKS